VCSLVSGQLPIRAVSTVCPSDAADGLRHWRYLAHHPQSVWVLAILVTAAGCLGYGGSGQCRLCLYGQHPKDRALPGWLSTLMLPVFSMMPRQSGSPKPVPTPGGFVVKKGSKSRACRAGGIPGPVSPPQGNPVL